MLVFFWFYDSFLPLDTSACESNKLYKLLCCDIDVVLLSVLLLGNNCNIRLLYKYHLSGGKYCSFWLIPILIRYLASIKALPKPSVENLPAKSSSNGVHQGSFHLPLINFLSPFTTLKFFLALKGSLCFWTRIKNKWQMFYTNRVNSTHCFNACDTPKSL